MSRFDHYEPCPTCRANGRDSRGDNLAVWSDGSSHCFSCGHHAWPKHYVPREERKVGPNASKVLPADFTRQVPASGWKWLLQYGLSYRYWEPFTGYSEEDQRVILCVPDSRNPSFSVGRYIGEEPDKRKWHTYGNSHETAHVWGDYRESKEIVLVEDLVSAHKVGQVNASICLFGTRVFDSVVSTLRHIRLPVVMWLDNDQKEYAVKRANALSVLTNLPVRYIFTENDPKENSLENIRKLLT